MCCANQLTDFYMRATLAFNGLTAKITPDVSIIFTCRARAKGFSTCQTQLSVSDYGLNYTDVVCI